MPITASRQRGEREPDGSDEGVLVTEIDIWLPYYAEICADLSIDERMDRESAKMLSRMIFDNKRIEPREGALSEAARRITGRPAYVFGAGPDLEEELDRATSENPTWGGKRTDVLIAADGSTSTLLSRGLVPDVIVTDLDGSLEDQISCLDKGSVMFVHAHGDNINMLLTSVPRLRGLVVGTTQADPTVAGGLDNFGGFSDGDRAAFLAQHFGATRIVLLGFDFNEVGDKIGLGGARRPLSAEEEKLKFKKMAWAYALLGLITKPQVRSFSETYPLFTGL
jgi:uncharacterized Rossmann fold enzyme